VGAYFFTCQVNVRALNSNDILYYRTSFKTCLAFRPVSVMLFLDPDIASDYAGVAGGFFEKT
ncbi:MAG: hypothetical protein OEY57_16820, partial [Nitrospirota bacterium]|nr:hypothetical protein [Nitrospirota bacterium]